MIEVQRRGLQCSIPGKAPAPKRARFEGPASSFIPLDKLKKQEGSERASVV